MWSRFRRLFGVTRAGVRVLPRSTEGEDTLNHRPHKLLVASVSTRLASVNDEGMHLEVLAKEDSLPYSSELLFSVVAVEGEKLLLEFLADKVFVRVPIEDVERALVMARSQVHSEGWYP